MAQMGFFDLFIPLRESRFQEGPAGRDQHHRAVGGVSPAPRAGLAQADGCHRDVQDAGIERTL